MNETRKRLIVDLLERYKEKFLNVSLAGPYKEGERANEIYKWQLITNCSGNSEAEIVEKFKDENVIDRAHDRIVLLDLLENQRQQVGEAFAILEQENVSLIDRLSEFKATMAALCDKKYKSKADDERTASAFLACWNPQKYTFYMNGLYKNYCEYIGEQPRAVGEKYPHYLQLLPELIEIIKQDAELMNKFRNETNGLIQSDLLIAQNILWQMRNLMKNNVNLPSFWSGGIKWDEGKTNKLDDFNNECCWQIGWDKNDNSKGAKQAWSNIQKVNIGDYLAFHGYGGKNDLTIYQISRVTSKNETEGKLYFERLNKSNDELFHGKAPKMDKGSWWGTLFQIIGEEAINQIFGNYLGTMENNQEMKEYTHILQLKKNIILQGAPGTGKTYNTAALALSICGETIPESHEDVMKRYEELRKEGRIGFCTFHQSMDYEGFVEGIKPKTENGAISYDVEDGIFKALSDKARENYEDSQKTIEVLQKQKSIQDKMYDFLQDALENRTEFLTRLGYKFIITEITDKNIIVSIITENNIATGEPIKNSTLTIRLSELTELLEKEVVLNEIGDIPAYFNRKTKLSRDYYTFYIANEINKIKTKNVNVQKTELQNYVLIIDEINRGNVSKIFGELITLLEADKRIGGEHPIKVTLPYSKESFGVPSNLYIIGTMNTTDRSVGNIDYAVRRRFAFVTLESKEEVIEQHYKNDETMKNKALGLFNSVKSFLEKHKFDMDIADLMVGHSYFLAKDEEELGLKWKYEIVPLLHEYYKDGITKQDVKADTSIDDFCNSK